MTRRLRKGRRELPQGRLRALELALNTHAAHTATASDSAHVFLIGGNDGSGSPLSTGEIFSASGALTSGTFALVGSALTNSRAHHVAIPMGTTLLIAGGNAGSGAVELFDPLMGLGTFGTTGSAEALAASTPSPPDGCRLEADTCALLCPHDSL